MVRKLDSSKSALWAERLKRFEASSLTVARFCAEEGYSTAAFYQWRRKLRKSSSPRRTTTKPNQATSPERFRPLTIAITPARVGIHFPSGTRLELAGDNHELVCAVVREILRGEVLASSGEA
jgi:transposase-like protein